MRFNSNLEYTMITTSPLKDKNLELLDLCVGKDCKCFFFFRLKCALQSINFAIQLSRFWLFGNTTVLTHQIGIIF